MHDPVSPKPKKIRKNQPHARLIDVGFRTYVRYEVGKRGAPVKVPIKMAKLGNISLDQLLTTARTVDKLEIPGSETTPIKPRKMEIIGGGLKKGRERFAGLKNDYFITIDKLEKNCFSPIESSILLKKKNSC